MERNFSCVIDNDGFTECLSVCLRANPLTALHTPLLQTLFGTACRARLLPTDIVLMLLFRHGLLSSGFLLALLLTK